MVIAARDPGARKVKGLFIVNDRYQQHLDEQKAKIGKNTTVETWHVEQSSAQKAAAEKDQNLAPFPRNVLNLLRRIFGGRG